MKQKKQNKNDEKSHCIQKRIQIRSLKISLLVILFAIIFFSPFISAHATDHLPTGCEVALKLDFGNESATPTGVEQNWKSYSILALLVSSSLLAAIYIIGKSIDNPSLVARAKTDLIQVGVTAIMLVFLYSFLTTICLIDMRELGFDFSSPFEGARNYFDYARTQALKSYLESTNSIMIITGLSSMSINSPTFLSLGTFLQIGIYFKPFAGYGIAIGTLNWFASLVMLSYSLMTGFIIVLDSIQLYFLNLILPAGVVLRCFSPTRDFGGVLISLSIGLFIFYPLLFSFSYMIINKQSTTFQNMNWESKIYSTVAKVAALSTIPFGSTVQMIGSINADGDDTMNKMNDAFTSLGGVFLPVFILPAINWIILVAIIRELSKVLGQEVDISGLARMI